MLTGHILDLLNITKKMKKNHNLASSSLLLLSKKKRKEEERTVVNAIIKLASLYKLCID